MFLNLSTAISAKKNEFFQVHESRQLARHSHGSTNNHRRVALFYFFDCNGWIRLTNCGLFLCILWLNPAISPPKTMILEIHLAALFELIVTVPVDNFTIGKKREARSQEPGVRMGTGKIRSNYPGLITRN